MTLPHLLLSYSKSELPGPVIVCTDYPYHWASIWTYMDKDKFAEKVANSEPRSIMVVPGYMVVVQYEGNLVGSEHFASMLIILQAMTEFCLTELIQARPGRYNKMKLK